MENSRNQMMIVGGVAVVVLAGIVWMATKGPKKDVADKKATPQNMTLAFHPDRVTEFVWKSTGKKFHFLRQSVEKGWEPRVDSQYIQSRLNLLSLQNYIDIPESKDSGDGVEVSVSFGSKEEPWFGQFNRNSFVWKTGPLAKKGFSLADRDGHLVTEGQHAFEERRLELCPQRVKSIAFTGMGQSFVVKRDGPNWVKETGTEKHKADPTFMEQWLGRNCSQMVEYYLDTALVQQNEIPFKGTLEIAYDKGSSTQINFDNGHAWFKGPRVFYSSNFKKAVNEISVIK